jgi:hypothetical protein
MIEKFHVMPLHHRKFTSPKESPHDVENLCHEKNHLMMWEIRVTKKFMSSHGKYIPVQQKFTLCLMFFLGVFGL